jgi:hypothetical protein
VLTFSVLAITGVRSLHSERRRAAQIRRRVPGLIDEAQEKRLGA